MMYVNKRNLKDNYLQLTPIAIYIALLCDKIIASESQTLQVQHHITLSALSSIHYKEENPLLQTEINLEAASVPTELFTQHANETAINHVVADSNESIVPFIPLEIWTQLSSNDNKNDITTSYEAEDTLSIVKISDDSFNNSEENQSSENDDSSESSTTPLLVAGGVLAAAGTAVALSSDSDSDDSSSSTSTTDETTSISSPLTTEDITYTCEHDPYTVGIYINTNGTVILNIPEDDDIVGFQFEVTGSTISNIGDPIPTGVLNIFDVVASDNMVLAYSSTLTSLPPGTYDFTELTLSENSTDLGITNILMVGIDDIGNIIEIDTPTTTEVCAPEDSDLIF